MNEILPLEFKHTFKCNIISSYRISKIGNTTYYKCATNFGRMTLIIEQLYSQHQCFHQKQQQINLVSLSPKEIFQKRNHYLSTMPFCSFNPIIFQQYIITIHKDRSICLTLTEQVQLMLFQNCKNNIQFQRQKNIILFLSFVESVDIQFSLNLNQDKIKQIVFLKSSLTSNLYFNFSQLTFGKPLKCSSLTESYSISNFLKLFYAQQDEKAQNFQKLDQIILIKDRLFRYQKQKILDHQFNSWLEAAIQFNFLLEKQVFIKVKQKNSQSQFIQKIKKVPIKNISHQQKHLVEFSTTQNFQTQTIRLNFYDGYCIELLKEIAYQDLLSNFFIDHSTYILKKNIYLSVEILKSQKNSCLQKQQQTQKQKQMQKQKIKTDVIFIQQGVAKFQCINFFITYFKFIDPILRKIYFDKHENSLVFQFLGKFKVQRKLKLIFYSEYIIKDEQLSMILEKSKLQQTILILSQMQITDSLLMFLANSQKMKKIKHLDISYCKRITENGVNSLLISPFCKYLEVLNVSGSPLIQSSIQIISLKSKMKQLYMNNCAKIDQIKQNFIFKNMNLIRLQAIGMNLEPNFSQNLEYLKVDIQVPVDYLKILKDLPLKQLTLRLVEGKKNIIGGLLGNLGNIGNFYPKQSNSVKAFAQGKLNKTLKKVNFSNSMIKMKSVKAIFYMNSIQSLILQELKLSQQIDFSISPAILELSLADSLISIKQIGNLLKQTKIMMKLNVANTLIKKQQIADFLFQTKKYINTLRISQDQYSESLIDENGKSSQYVQTFQMVSSQSLFKRKNDIFVRNIMLKFLKSKKTFKFKLQGQINELDKKQIRKFQNTALKCLSNFLTDSNYLLSRNLYVNQKGLDTLFQENLLRKNIQKRNNCQQFICIHKRFKRPIVLNLNKKSFYSNTSHFNNNSDRNLKLDQQLCFQSISHFSYLFRKMVLQNNDSIFQISLQNNKIIDCGQALKMIISYFPQQNIKSINFKGATLDDGGLFEKMIDISYLQSFNHNQYQIELSNDNFVNVSQKYLKFFMKIMQIKKLKVKCLKIIEVDILFSILFHIIDYHFQSVEELICQFDQINMSHQNSSSFWMKVCELKKLKSLQLYFKNSPTNFLKSIFLNSQINQFNTLENFKIEGVNYQNIPIFKNGNKLQSLNLNVQNSQIVEATILKILKPVSQGLKILQLNFNSCSSIAYPNKLFPTLNNFVCLEKLTLSFQYCFLKLLSTLDFLENLYTLKTLQELEINFSFIPLHYSQVSSLILNFSTKLPKCHLRIYLIGTLPKQSIIDRQGLQTQGVQIIL